MITPENERIDRLPAWIQRVTQDLDVSPVYDARFWNPPQKYQWKNKAPPKPTSLKVYEAHGKDDNVLYVGDEWTRKRG
jgi:1,4-alpha-glucan branching enzyme